MIYFDNAATGYRKPPVVIEAVCRALQGTGNAGRGVNEASLSAARLVFETRSLLSAMFGGDGPSQTVFTANATEALNVAAEGLLHPGDHVVTTVLEHNSVLRPLYRLQDRGILLTIVGADAKGRLDMAALERAVRPDTRAVFCTHASNLTGNLVDIARIGAMTRKKGLLFVVDAAQTAGLFPIDMSAMGIDALCLTGHKSLMGPQGTGALLLREGVMAAPLKVGGSGIRTFDREHPAAMPTRLEAGTLNVHGIAGLGAALRYISSVGQDRIRAREQALAARFYSGIRAVPGVTVYGDFEAAERAPIVSLNLTGVDSGVVSDALMTSYGIVTRSGGHCAPLMHRALGTEKTGAVRFSFGYDNTEEEVDTAIRAIRELAE